MGVRKLWTILEPTGQLAKLSDLRGYRVAIDLSCWIVEMSQITNNHGEKMPGLKPHIRNLFWRCYHLLRNQVRPVFVIDGMSPAVKGKIIEKRKVAMGTRSPSPERKGRGDCGRIDECKELLDCLGVPYVVSSGEAEALCAKLDREGLVDGCITSDSDVFLYGANTVYRNFTCNKQKTGEMRVYHAAHIEEKLGLNREKLVAMALLIGSDYTDGAKNIGPETAIKLIGKDCPLSNTNVLERMRSWRADPEGKFAALEQLQTLSKPAHCSKCNHQGGIILHKAKGCAKCGTKKACKENFGECDCEYHNKQQEVSSNALELRVRRWAIEDPDFPSEQVIKEYLKPECDPVEDFQKVEWIRPDFSKLHRYLEEVLKFSKSDARQKTNELLVSWGMTHSKAKHQKDPLKCVRVMKARVQNSVPVLEVLWEDQGLGDLDLVTMEERETMVKHFPRAVELFEEENDKRVQSKKKTNKFNKVCKRIADLFKSKKKLAFPQEDSSLASDSTRDNVRPISFKSSVTPNSSKCTYSHPPDSPPVPDADSLVDAPPADFSEFLCAKLPDSSPEKSPNKAESTEVDRFPILKRRGRKRKSYCLDTAREAKKLKLGDVPSGLIQPGVADIFKMKSDSAIASIPGSSAPVSTRSRACSSDFTDGASTCSDLISDDDNETDVPVPSTSTTSNVINLSSAQTTSAKSAPQTVIPSLRRSPRESVRQKALQYHSVTPSKGSRKRLRFSDGDKQPKINDFMRSTKSSRLSGIRL